MRLGARAPLPYKPRVARNHPHFESSPEELAKMIRRWGRLPETRMTGEVDSDDR
jgi:hypothetical protein